MPELCSNGLSERVSVVVENHLRVFGGSGGEVDKHRIGCKNLASGGCNELGGYRCRVFQFMLVSNPWGGETLKRVIVNDHSELEVRTVCGNFVHFCHIFAVGDDHLKSACIDAVFNILDGHHVRARTEDCTKLHNSED